MSEIHVRENETLESALKRFKRSCAKSGVLAEVPKRPASPLAGLFCHRPKTGAAPRTGESSGKRSATAG